eukprot:CAMPEP_0116955320 /NCGR_PEP_ID=MMETSP0467-20121206/42543_1 /TAXON_ID=283647 /ORGANISM="Mesodinium pulex, Strain SPMC105" /LENGTH=30 /DNA_ID= /DNA_START= /DNA_END= /DNA_ORIENTATION=
MSARGREFNAADRALAQPMLSWTHSKIRRD